MTAVVRRLLPAVLCTVAIACASLPGARETAAPGSATVTVVHFSDMHEMVATSGGRIGGIARVATVVGRERRAGEAVLVTLGGDYLSPSALSIARVDGQPLAGRQAVAALNLLGVDWSTFGNHEFDLTEEAFRARLGEIRFGVVSSNVTDQNGRPFAPAVPSAIATVRTGGRTLRIGFIGLTIDFTLKPYVRYLPAIESARAQVAAMSGKTDAIIALTHQAIATDAALAYAMPEIDLILGGHEHENIVLRRGPGFSVIAKGDANAKSVVLATLTFPADGSRPQAQARIEALNERVTPDAAMAAEVRRWTDAAFAAFRRDGFDPETVVATLPEALDGRDSTVRVRRGNLTELIAGAIARDAKDADVAILNGGSVRIDDTLPAGPVTEYDIIRVLPFGGKILKAAVEGALLVDILDAGVLNQGTGGFLHPRGAIREGAEWRVAGQPIDPKRRYTIAVPEYMLTGGETRLNFLTRTNPQVHDVQELSDIRQAVIAEMKARYPSREPVTVTLRPALSRRAAGILLRAPAW